MEVTINISDRLLKKIKALAILQEDASQDFEAIIEMYLEDTISTQIIALVEGKDKRSQLRPTKVSADTQIPAQQQEHYNQNTVAVGLGDEEPESSTGTEDMYAFVPQKGGITFDDIENDMRIEDPDHEAISGRYDGPTDGVSAEELFSSQLNLPTPPSDSVDLRAERRHKHMQRLATTRKAKVTEIIGEP